MTASSFAWKVLGPDGAALMGRGKWHLPKREPGKWMMPIKGELLPCENGYHVCERDGLIDWLGPAIFECEWRGESVWKDKLKVRVVREARLIRKLDTWNYRTACLFAADCAERVLHLYEAKYPEDGRVRNCIEIVRQVARGELPVSKLDAARAAARDAAWDAAWDAALAAALDAARTAAWDAARDAARTAARDAERNWQSRRLWQYLNGELT